MAIPETHSFDERVGRRDAAEWVPHALGGHLQMAGLAPLASELRIQPSLPESFDYRAAGDGIRWDWGQWKKVTVTLWSNGSQTALVPPSLHSGIDRTLEPFIAWNSLSQTHWDAVEVVAWKELLGTSGDVTVRIPFPPCRQRLPDPTHNESTGEISIPAVVSTSSDKLSVEIIELVVGVGFRHVGCARRSGNDRSNRRFQLPRDRHIRGYIAITSGQGQRLRILYVGRLEPQQSIDSSLSPSEWQEVYQALGVSATPSQTWPQRTQDRLKTVLAIGRLQFPDATDRLNGLADTDPQGLVRLVILTALGAPLRVEDAAGLKGPTLSEVIRAHWPNVSGAIEVARDLSEIQWLFGKSQSGRLRETVDWVRCAGATGRNSLESSLRQLEFRARLRALMQTARDGSGLSNEVASLLKFLDSSIVSGVVSNRTAAAISAIESQFQIARGQPIDPFGAPPDLKAPHGSWLVECERVKTWRSLALKVLRFCQFGQWRDPHAEEVTTVDGLLDGFNSLCDLPSDGASGRSFPELDGALVELRSTFAWPDHRESAGVLVALASKVEGKTQQWTELHDILQSAPAVAAAFPELARHLGLHAGTGSLDLLGQAQVSRPLVLIAEEASVVARSWATFSPETWGENDALALLTQVDHPAITAARTRLAVVGERLGVDACHDLPSEPVEPTLAGYRRHWMALVNLGSKLDELNRLARCLSKQALWAAAKLAGGDLAYYRRSLGNESSNWSSAPVVGKLARVHLGTLAPEAVSREELLEFWQFGRASTNRLE